jgi:hypothetical protein
LQVFQCGANVTRETIGLDEFMKGIRCRGEAIGHKNPLILQGADHFSQGSVLPTHDRDIIRADIRKPVNVQLLLSHFLLLLRESPGGSASLSPTPSPL